MALNYRKCAEEIVGLIGGRDNVAQAAHCATRLRLVIKDNSKVNKEALDEVEGVQGIFESIGQLQLIIGTGTVNKVYDEFLAVTGMTAATKVYGEAMLTMQSAPQKNAIVREAARLLKAGGLYAIHEIVICPDDAGSELQRTIEKDLAHSIKTNVRPLMFSAWRAVLEENGFEVVWTKQSPMHLLEWRRVVADEGWGGFLRIVWRMLRNAPARKRVLHMRSIFRKHDKNIQAISMVARKRA